MLGPGSPSASSHASGLFHRALLAVGRVLEHGARKYAPNNWTRAPSWMEYVHPMFRHLLAWMSGEDKDPDTGESHIAHLACDALFLLEFIESKTSKDDRLKMDGQ